MEQVEIFLEAWKNTALAVMSFFTFIGIISAVFYRAYNIIDNKRKAQIKKDSAIAERFKNIEQRLYHLDDKETGRVHMVSDLCKEQIETNKKAWAMANYVKGRLDEL